MGPGVTPATPRQSSADASTAAPSRSVGERFRFLTAGESHGADARRHVEGVPAGLAAHGGGSRRRTWPDGSVATAAGRASRSSTTRPRSSPACDTAGRWARRSCSWSRTGTARTGPRDAGRGPVRTRRRELEAAAEGGDKKATPVTRVRPGHGDLAGALKYGHEDVRNVLERASARETAARVAAGGVARAFLRELGHRRLVVHRRGRRRGGRPATRDPLPRGGRRVAAALPRSRGGGAR